MTYWRWPGPAGVPPRLSSAASTNVSGLSVAYPVPSRVDEAGEEVLGYRHRVVLPVTVTAWDPGMPGMLHLTLDYSTCDRLCVPAHAEFVADFPPSAEQATATASPASARPVRQLAASEGQGPFGAVSPPSPAVPSEQGTPFPGSVTPTGPSTWRVDLPPDADVDDLLAGSDDADASTTRAGPASYVLRVEHARPGGTLTLVAAGVRPRSWTVALPRP